jgi:hypothetical protein
MQVRVMEASLNVATAVSSGAEAAIVRTRAKTVVSVLEIRGGAIGGEPSDP